MTSVFDRKNMKYIKIRLLMAWFSVKGIQLHAKNVQAKQKLLKLYLDCKAFQEICVVLFVCFSICFSCRNSKYWDCGHSYLMHLERTGYILFDHCANYLSQLFTELIVSLVVYLNYFTHLIYSPYFCIKHMTARISGTHSVSCHYIPFFGILPPYTTATWIIVH